MLKHLKVKSDHLLLGTEACHCPSTGYQGGDLKVAWARAERYAHTILSDLAAKLPMYDKEERGQVFPFTKTSLLGSIIEVQETYCEMQYQARWLFYSLHGARQ